MKSINIQNHTKESLTFIFNEVDKHFNSVYNALKATSNRSFFLFGVYLSLGSFAFLKVMGCNYEYLFILFGCLISSIVLLKNIVPFLAELSGSSASDIIDPYFDDFSDEELEKELIATQIESYEKSKVINKKLTISMGNRYKYSYMILLIFIFCFVLCLLS